MYLFLSEKYLWTPAQIDSEIPDWLFEYYLGINKKVKAKANKGHADRQLQYIETLFPNRKG